MLSDLLKKRSNPFIKNLQPYQPGKPIEELTRETGLQDIIKLASNENPLGPSPLALQAVSQGVSSLHYYPDGGAYELKQALSEHFALSPQAFTVGNGSENLIEILVKALGEPGDEAIVSAYTFATIPLVLQAAGMHLQVVPTQNWRCDVPAFIAAIRPNSKMVFIVNPNNPTGTYVNREGLASILSHVSSETWVIVDEAYNEYIHAEDYSEALPYLSQYPNLIILRTFSKIYGLAGLRLGYAISHPDVADLLNRARLPFNVNSLALRAGVAALRDQAHVRASVKLNDEGMQQYEKGLLELGLNFIPSVANFITVDVGDAAKIYQRLLAKGVIVRPLQAYGMPKHIRISIGHGKDNARALKALKECLR